MKKSLKKKLEKILVKNCEFVQKALDRTDNERLDLIEMRLLALEGQNEQQAEEETENHGVDLEDHHFASGLTAAMAMLGWNPCAQYDEPPVNHPGMPLSWHCALKFLETREYDLVLQILLTRLVRGLHPEMPQNVRDTIRDTICELAMDYLEQDHALHIISSAGVQRFRKGALVAKDEAMEVQPSSAEEVDVQKSVSMDDFIKANLEAMTNCFMPPKARKAGKKPEKESENGNSDPTIN